MSRRIVKRRITPPSAPVLAAALTVSETELDIVLQSPSVGTLPISTYALERSTNQNTWVAVASGLGIFGSGATYHDTGLTAETTYYYRCRATDTSSRVSGYGYTSGYTSLPPNNEPVWSSGWALTIAAGSSQSVAGYASDPNGDSLTFTRIGGTAPAGVTVTLAGWVEVAAGTAAGDYTITIRASDGDLVADTTASVTVQAATTAGLVMSTRFASGVSLVNSVSYTSGGEIRLSGTDSITNFNFTTTNPQIWGGYNTTNRVQGADLLEGIIPAASIQLLSVGAANLAATRLTHILGFEDNVAYTHPITLQSSTQRALKIYRTDGYDGTDQDSYQLYPSPSLPQGMFYVRAMVKFDVGFFTDHNLWGVSLSEAKTNTRRRVQLSLANWSSTGWRVRLAAEDEYGANRLWEIENTPGPSFLVDNCLLFEFAARYSTGSNGWAWAAINGSSTFGGQTFARSGANLPVGDTGFINRLFPFLYYNGYTTGASVGVNNPQWFLSAEVWDRWPLDASSHPAWT